MISKETLVFLKDLDKNNDRDWFLANKGRFEIAKADFTDFVAFMIGKISEFDPSAASVLPQDCVFRIYRDVRFSKNKNPYKDHFGAYISQGGRKSAAPGYYFHLQPGKSFIAGGKYQPDSGELLKLRNSIANNTDEFLGILKEKTFKKTFGDMDGEKLKTTPKGFQADHKAIEYLRLKDFVASREFFDDAVVTSKEFPAALVKNLNELYPLIKFLRKALA